MEKQLEKILAATFSNAGILTLLYAGTRGHVVRQIFSKTVLTFETDTPSLARRIFAEWLDKR